MPRGQLSERYVQRVAVWWLEERLRTTCNARAVAGELEAVVRVGTKLGSGRADGLVAARMPDGYVYTAALEAKSAKTRRNVVTWDLDDKWVLHASLIGGLGLLVAGIVGWIAGGWLWMVLLSVPAFFAVGLAYLLLTSEHHRYQSIDVIAQVERYPADERWVALPSAFYDSLLNKDKNALCASCQRNGIGLILVKPANGAESSIPAKPVTSPQRRSDYLSCYARERTIRQKLQDEPDGLKG